MKRGRRRWGEHLTRHDRLQAIILIRWCQACAKTDRWLHWGLRAP
jgi:hypothetical protein